MDSVLDSLRQDISNGFGGVPPSVAALRLVAALLLAGLIGLEREVRDKPAGLRTHMLVSVAACLFILISQQLVATPFMDAGDALRVDPLRLIEAVTAGVAFLAAGLIFASGGEVRNVTTGASLWLTGAIGLSCGSGEIAMAALATGLVLCVLILLRMLERWMGTR
ncbi:MgtC/SapB family protein [Sedimentitalea sp. JM2-8]|uniref:Protein MgtC n=1 Tax=Sedimentitalea xiamensis TaxID=3050037 RepID=A0ABT7F9R8_9RHOB|nr:MgtC/SapB family protein [Sedimentitalea xiamensis]MDK3071860.1 MgtC/SapB family protein [Sedimentitalea xiamensis]